MTALLRHLPAAIATIVVTALLAVFIAYPIGAVLVESAIVRGPMPIERLKAVTEEALAVMPDDERSAAVGRWMEAADVRQQVEATAAAFELGGHDVPWPRHIAFSDQANAMKAALARLDGATRAAVEAEYPVALVMLHKRIALAFAVRERIEEAAFERLRSGSEFRWGIDHYLKPLQDDYLHQALLNSLSLAGTAVLFTVSVGFALAYAINCGAVPSPPLVRGLLLLHLVAPPVLIATATIMLFGRRGLITHTLLDQTLGWIDADTTNIYGPLGIVVAQMMSFLPATLIVLDAALRKKDGRLDEAAVSLGASRAAAFRHVTLALAWPGLKRATVLVFILSLTDFGNPMILGDTPVIAAIIFDEITAFQNTPLAAALCVWLIAPSLLLYIALDLIGRRKRYVAGTLASTSEFRPGTTVRISLTCLAAAIGALILAIHATILLGSVTRIWGVDWSLTFDYFTAAGVNVGHSGSGYGSSDRGLETVADSVFVAGIAAPLGGLFGLVVAYVVERIRPPGGNTIAFLVLIPAILPGIIFGVGYIIAFNAPFGIEELSLLGTSTVLILNILFGNLFVGVLAARAALQRLDPAVDEAAESLGAGMVARFIHVTLPMLKPAFLLGALYVFVDGLTTLSSVIFLVSGDHKLASVAIFNSANSAEYGYAAAKSVAILALAITAVGLAWLVERRGQRRLPTAPGNASASGMTFDIVSAEAR